MLIFGRMLLLSILLVGATASRQPRHLQPNRPNLPQHTCSPPQVPQHWGTSDREGNTKVRDSLKEKRHIEGRVAVPSSVAREWGHADNGVRSMEDNGGRTAAGVDNRENQDWSMQDWHRGWERVGGVSPASVSGGRPVASRHSTPRRR